MLWGFLEGKMLPVWLIDVIQYAPCIIWATVYAGRIRTGTRRLVRPYACTCKDLCNVINYALSVADKYKRHIDTLRSIWDCQGSGMFVDGNTDNFQADMREKIVSLVNRVRRSPNRILNDFSGRYSYNPILTYWIGRTEDEAQLEI